MTTGYPFPVLPHVELLPRAWHFNEDGRPLQQLTVSVLAVKVHHAASVAYQLAAVLEMAMEDVPREVRRNWLVTVDTGGMPSVNLDLHFVKGMHRPTPQEVETARRLIAQAIERVNYPAQPTEEIG